MVQLRAIRNLVSPQPPPPAHGELEHVHWDRETRTWQPHEEPAAEESSAA